MNEAEPARFSTTNPPDGISGRGGTGQSFRQSPNRSEQADDSAVGSLPTSETVSERLSRVAELGAILPTSLVSLHFVLIKQRHNCAAHGNIRQFHAATMHHPIRIGYTVR
jgi:hypothetical protein